MPYPRAWIYVTGLLLLTVPAFWPFYFSRLGEVPWQHHVHAITSILWMGLLIGQSWTIHHRRRALHKSTGLLSLLLAPIFLAGGMVVIGTMAGGTGQFAQRFGMQLTLIDAINVVAFAFLFYAALRYRRNMHLHAGYMLATPFLLVMPVLARLCSNFVPGLTIRSPEQFARFDGSFYLSTGIGIAVALFIAGRAGRKGGPFALIATVLGVQAIAFATTGNSGPWASVYGWLATASPVTLALIGITLGLVAGCVGWVRPARGARPSRTPMAPA